MVPATSKSQFTCGKLNSPARITLVSPSTCLQRNSFKQSKIIWRVWRPIDYPKRKCTIAIRYSAPNSFFTLAIEFHTTSVISQNNRDAPTSTGFIAPYKFIMRRNNAVARDVRTKPCLCNCDHAGTSRKKRQFQSIYFINHTSAQLGL